MRRRILGAVFFTLFLAALLPRPGEGQSVDQAGIRLTKKRDLEGNGFAFQEGLVFSPDGRTLAAGRHKYVSLFDTATWTEQKIEGLASHVMSVAWTPDGRGLATVDTEIRLWDLASRRTIRKFEGFEGSCTRAAISPSGAILAVAIESRNANYIQLWDASTGAPARRLQGDQEAIQALAFSPGGSALATAGFDGRVVVWDPGTGEIVRRLESIPGRHAGFRCLAYSRDGSVLAAGEKTFVKEGSSEREVHSIHVWEAASGREKFLLQGHGADVRSVAFSPGGSILVSASENPFGGTSKTSAPLRFWSAGTGQEILQCSPERGGFEIGRLVLSPDARTLILAAPMTLSIWDLVLPEAAVPAVAPPPQDPGKGPPKKKKKKKGGGPPAATPPATDPGTPPPRAALGPPAETPEGFDFTFSPSLVMKSPGHERDTLIVSFNGVSAPVAEAIFVAYKEDLDAPPPEMDAAARERLTHRLYQSVDQIHEEVVRNVRIGGLAGRETEATCLEQGRRTPLVLYQLVLFQDRAIYVLKGRCPAGRRDEFLETFRQMGASFRRK